MKKTTKHARKGNHHTFGQAQNKRPELLYTNPIFKVMLPKHMRQNQQVRLTKPPKASPWCGWT